MKTTRFSIDRRSLLRGAVASIPVGLALPRLDAMLNGNGTSYAAGAPLPRRFGVWFWGNGARLTKWLPKDLGPTWTPSESLAPLSTVKPYVSVVTGTVLKTGRFRAHHDGQVGIMTAAPLIAQQPQGGAPYASTFRTKSLDQIAAAALGTGTRFPSLQIGVSKRINRGEGTGLAHISHNGPDSPNPAELEPARVFNRLFAGAVKPPANGMAPVDVSRVLRKSVLDAVLEDLNALGGRVGAADRARLDQHATHVRAIESRLSAAPTTSAAACQPPGTAPTINAPGTADPLEEVNRAQADLLAMALACDLTRVFAFQFSSGVDGAIYSEAGVGTPHHQLTHDEAGDQPGVQKITAFIIKQLAYFIERLAKTPEGAGNVLDQCSILGTSDCAEGLLHSLENYPLLVMGGGGGTLKHPGVHVRLNGVSSSRVLLTALRAGGVPLASLGMDGGFADMGTSEIEA